MGKKKWKPIIQMVREFLPAPGTMVGEFTFLSPDALWGGILDNGLSFVAVAEDRWPDGGMFLMVLEDGCVYVGDLDGYCLVNYCAASFPKFKMIMEAYQEAVETTPYPEEADWEGFKEHCERAEQVLWQQILEEEFEECRKNAEQFLRQVVMDIDPTAIADAEGFWSTIIEEFGAGMCV